MSEDRITVSFECPNCGPTTLQIADDPTDSSIVSCKVCGQTFGTYGQLKAQAMSAAKSEVKNIARNAFKGIKGFKIK